MEAKNGENQKAIRKQNKPISTKRRPETQTLILTFSFLFFVLCARGTHKFCAERCAVAESNPLYFAPRLGRRVPEPATSTNVHFVVSFIHKTTTDYQLQSSSLATDAAESVAHSAYEASLHSPYALSLYHCSFIIVTCMCVRVTKNICTGNTRNPYGKRNRDIANSSFILSSA